MKHSNSTDYIIRTIINSGGIRIIAASLPVLAAKVCHLQGTSPTATVALGRGLVAAALMGALLKPDQRVALKFEGNGDLRKLIVEAEYGGIVRGCVGNPDADSEPVNGSWNVPGIIGRAGFLTVSKDIGIGGEPYRGMVQLQTSEIGNDLAFYLTDSEQIPSAVGLGVILDANGKITECGGFLVQALPGATEEQIDEVMSAISSLSPISGILADGGAELLVSSLFSDAAYTVLEKNMLQFSCGCSEEKVMKALASLPKKEIEDMIMENKPTGVKCEFCKQNYTVTTSMLESLIVGTEKATLT